MTAVRVRSLLLLALFFSSGVAIAQEPATPPPDDGAAVGSDAQQDSIDKLLARLDTADRKLVALRAEAKTASGEELELLRRQIQDAELKQGQEIHRAAERVLAEHKDGSGTGKAWNQIRDLLATLPDTIVRVLDARERVLDEYRKERDASPPEKAMEAERRLSSAARAFDDVLRYYARQIDLMQRFDLDVTDAKSDAIRRLTQRADYLSARIRIAVDERTQLRTVLAANPADTEAQQRQLLIAERIKSDVSSLNRLVQDLGKLGVDTTGYQEELLKATGDVSAVGLNLKVLSALADDWMDQARSWLRDNGTRVVTKSLLVLVILLGTWLLARIVKSLTRKALRSRHVKVSSLLGDMLVSLAGNFVKILGILVVLSQIGVSVGPMLAGLGIAGFVLGFALQDTLSNFASGAMILFYRPFDVGDVIEAAGISGKVSSMNLVSTTILTFDNQTLIVPNNRIWGDVIRNVTRQTRRRIDLEFGIGYSDDIDHAEKILNEIVEQEDRVLDEPAPVVRLHSLGESSVNFIVRPWVRTADYWDVHWHVIREVKRRFDAEGISIPFPQRDVHHYFDQGVPPCAPGSGRDG